MIPIISSKDLREISKAVENKLKEIDSSLDLGRSRIKIRLGEDCFYVNNDLIKLKKIRETDKSCYLVTKHGLEKLQFISENGKFYKLVPTKFRPILKISGTSMHKKSFLEKLGKDRLKGRILDSGTGLGYSAIILSRTADNVITVEIDKNVIDIARLNPYSNELFENKKIILTNNDITNEIKKFKDQEFNFIVFDAGTVKSSENFFSLNNYKEAFRILKKKGKLYHYIPRHHIMRGRNFASEVIHRIKLAGFKIILNCNEGSYVIAKKF